MLYIFVFGISQMCSLQSNLTACDFIIAEFIAAEFGRQLWQYVKEAG